MQFSKRFERELKFEVRRIVRARKQDTSADERRKAYSGLRVTLNGKPARILGFRNRFGTVAQVPRGLSHEWSWDAIAHIVKNKGGRFRS